MIIKEQDKKVYIKHTENVEPVLDAVKVQREIYEERPRAERLGRYVGTIPGNIARQWSIECGATPGTREFMDYAKKKLMSGDYSKLIVEGF